MVLRSKGEERRLKLGACLVAVALVTAVIASGRVYNADSAERAKIYERVYPLSERTGSPGGS